uniref:Uncharacterized protein n=1 Tax=viral metagenome TaxID=1070528 RepID=A0A6H1ZLN0_9ZZZZ
MKNSQASQGFISYPQIGIIADYGKSEDKFTVALGVEWATEAMHELLGEEILNVLNALNVGEINTVHIGLTVLNNTFKKLGIIPKSETDYVVLGTYVRASMDIVESYVKHMNREPPLVQKLRKLRNSLELEDDCD